MGHLRGGDQDGIPCFEIGFDWSESQRTKIIHGAKQDSNAWHAGVRDGQNWSSIDVVVGDPSYLAEIEIGDKQGSRRIKYYPASTNTYLAPQYKAITDRCNPGTLAPTSVAR